MEGLNILSPKKNQGVKILNPYKTRREESRGLIF
jgi:hypothetical protein